MRKVDALTIQATMAGCSLNLSICLSSQRLCRNALVTQTAWKKLFQLHDASVRFLIIEAQKIFKLGKSRTPKPIKYIKNLNFSSRIKFGNFLVPKKLSSRKLLLKSPQKENFSIEKLLHVLPPQSTIFKIPCQLQISYRNKKASFSCLVQKVLKRKRK